MKRIRDKLTSIVGLVITILVLDILTTNPAYQRLLLRIRHTAIAQ